MQKKFPISIIADNIRSAHNVGSLFRLADCSGINSLYLTGLSPYPPTTDDTRKPWELETVLKKIHKTALGSESTVTWEYYPSILMLMQKLSNSGISVYTVERDTSAENIFTTEIAFPCALILGNEVDGISKEVIDVSKKIISIPQFGLKESLNVSSAAAIVTYECVRRLL